MSRALKAPFRPYEGRKTKDRHVRITKDMLDSEIFKSLKPSSKIMYIYLKEWACGQIEFTYSKSLGSNVVSPSTYCSAMKELIDKGFIDRVKFSNGGGHEANCYRFSSRWTNMS